MPVARRATPPTSQIREQLGVLTSLSAWTDNGEEDKPKNAKAKYRELQNDGEAYQPTWKEKLDAWLDVESDQFNMIIGLVIIGNAFVIGLETEFGAGSFTFFENLFNSIFLVEMVLRVRVMGKSYFTEPWNCFDFSLVASGTLDLWVLPLFSGGDSSSTNLYQFQAMRMLRMLRLMRVLRVIRLFRMFQQLFLIMQAFGKAFQIVLLMGLLVLILDYVCAIMLTQSIGHQTDMWQGEDQEKVQAWFGSIPNSMQTLFLVMTLTNWEEVSTVLVKELPPSVVYCTLVLYIMVTSYTMLSLITGIISESLITAQQEYRLRKEKLFDEKKKEISYELRNFLLNDCLEEDKDEHGNVKIDDLKTAMRGDTELLMKLASINIHITEQGVLALIERLASADGIVNIDYFVDKLTNLNGNASASSVMDLKFEMSKLSGKIALVLEHLDKADGGKPSSSSASASASRKDPTPTPAPRQEGPGMKHSSSHKDSKPHFAN